MLAAIRILVLTLEPRLAFFPQRDLALSPGAAGLPHENVEVETTDGLRLRGWFIPAAADPDAGGIAPADPASAAPAPILLVFHGNAETIADGLGLAARARRAGFATLLAEYRGYGGNPGSPSEEGIARDGLAFAAAAAARAAARSAVDGGATGGGAAGTGAAPVILWGRSIGAAVAARLAAAGHGRALILESPFTSARDLLRDDGAWLFLGLSYLGSYRFDTATRMPRVRMPVLVIHGTRDEIAPFAHGQRLLDLAPGPKSMVALEGGGHNDLWARHADTLWAAAERFVREAAAAAPGPPGIVPADPRQEG